MSAESPLPASFSMVQIPDRPREIVAEIEREVHRRLGDDARLLWFGSWVKGTARPTSDIDLAIKRPRRISHGQMVALRDWVDDLRTLYSVDLVDLGEVSDEFRQRVEAEGVEL